MSTSGGAYCRVLGPARVMIDGAGAPQELMWRKHLALLVYLARSPRRARTREHLLGLLWSDRDERQARHSLSEALGVLRRALGDAAVRADVDQVGLEAGVVALDTDRFVERYERGDWAGAASLVEGTFLEGLSVPEAGEFENWLAAERTEWCARGVEAIVRHAESRLAEGDVATAVHEARRALAIDRTAEAAARTAMRALALMGDRAAALRVADELVRTLGGELGAAPAKETVALAERIREARVGRRLAAAIPSAPPRSPLVGRAPQLAALAAAWERARAGRGQVVIVEGEPGEGVSRLLEEFVGRVRLEHATVATARAVPADRKVSWSALAGLLAGGFAEAPGLTGAPPAALARLREIAAGRDGIVTDLSMPDAVSAGVRAAAEERPVLLVLDDAQWIDLETLAALPGLARDTARRPVLIALGVALGAPEGTRFDELRARFGRDLEGVAVRVGCLDEAALRALVAWALPHYGSEDAERLLRRVEHDTARIPLLVVAMLEAVADGLRLAPATPVWPSPTRTLLDSLPNELSPAVIGSVCQQFGRLTPPAQRVLGAAAALAERTDSTSLARAAGLDPAVVEQALDLLEWERWLLADARGYVFAAPILRRILLQEMITPGQARRYRANPAT